MKRLWAIAIGMLAPLLASAANIALPPQPLAAALQELAKQSGIQIIFFSRVVAGREAPALNGTFTPEAALDRLLADTNLTYHSLNDRTIEVTARPAVAAIPWVPLPQPESASDAGEAPDAPLAEVEITAERANLSQLRAAIVRLENQFYARYNQANRDHRYDIVLCRSLKMTGTHLDKRVCGPAAFATDRGRAFLPGPYPGRATVHEEPASIKIPTDPEELRAYQRNMVEVVRKHAELLDLIKQHNELVERYQAARRPGF